MREVVVHPDAARCPAQFQPPPHALEAGQRFQRRSRFHADMARGADRGQCVHPVVPPGKVPTQASDRLALPGDLRRALLVRFAGHPSRRDAELFNRRPAPLSEYPLQYGVLPIHQDPPRTRYSSHEMMKLPLDRCKIDEDVSMIELQIVQNRRFWPVMHKFGALVEEGGVVLVRLDHETGFARRPGRDLQVRRHPTDEEARVTAGAFQDPGQHGRSSRLAVGPGNSQYPLTY